MLPIQIVRSVTRYPAIANRNFSKRIFARTKVSTHSGANHGKEPLPADLAGNESHHPHPHGPVEEKFGKGFFIAIAALVSTVALYNFEQRLSEDPSKSALTRLIDKYAELQAENEKKNTKRTELIEQAAREKSLLYDSKPSRVIPIRFEDQLNGGSPFNNEAGWNRSI